MMLLFRISVQLSVEPLIAHTDCNCHRPVYCQCALCNNVSKSILFVSTVAYEQCYDE